MLNNRRLNEAKERDRIQPKRHLLDVKRILAPTDLTPDGRKAVEYALALAKHFNARLTLLNVYDIPTTIDDIRAFECLVDACRQNVQPVLN
jgi:hypothetical protein